MPAITIRVRFEDTVDADRLFHIARDCFPGERLIQSVPGAYELELSEPRATFLLELMENIPDSQSFQPYVDWEMKHRDQFPLAFGSAAQVDDPFGTELDAA